MPSMLNYVAIDEYTSTFLLKVQQCINNKQLHTNRRETHSEYMHRKTILI